MRIMHAVASELRRNNLILIAHEYEYVAT